MGELLGSNINEEEGRAMSFQDIIEINCKYLACLSSWLTAGLDFIFLMLSWSAKVNTCSSVREVSKYCATVLENADIFSLCQILFCSWRLIQPDGIGKVSFHIFIPEEEKATSFALFKSLLNTGQVGTLHRQ